MWNAKSRAPAPGADERRAQTAQQQPHHPDVEEMERMKYGDVNLEVQIRRCAEHLIEKCPDGPEIVRTELGGN